MSQTRKTLLSVLLCFILIIFSFPIQTISANTSSSISFIVLLKYNATVDIGNEFYVIAFTSNLKQPSWKSSNSTIASVNTYGKVTAKKSGTVTITAKIKNAEASCKVTVNKTKISISKVSASIERGGTLKLSATTSNNSAITWKSSKKSIATIDEHGTVTGIKPGETILTATADGSNATCKIKVKSPTIKLNKTSITLYRREKAKLSAEISSGISPTWKTNKKSVAIVDGSGTITAVKHGTATITATVDGVSKSCEVVVKKPIITLSSSELNLKKDATVTITATVSSNLSPVWSSSNSNVATADTTGKITALKKGTAYIYAAEDGVKVK
ncbi:MAG: Ig-like domain-containing protein, partial [Ruminiclostridium sp.]